MSCWEASAGEMVLGFRGDDDGDEDEEDTNAAVDGDDLVVVTFD